MAKLVICEKPSVAADVAKALSSIHKFSKESWGFSSPDWLVTAAAGHLVESLAPEGYDERYKNWSYDDLPILPEEFKYEPRDDRAANRLSQIASLIRRPDVTSLVNAADAGREGELIFKLIVEYLDCQLPVERAWFSSMTPQAILAAFQSLRPDEDMKPLEAAARGRSAADWYVGMNGTRAASCTLGGSRLLSIGRVQTPTLAIVVNRDIEINDFVPQDFFRVKATFESADGLYDGWWFLPGPDGTIASDRFDDSAVADELSARCGKEKTATVESVDVVQEKVNAPKLFDLTELQKEANRRYGLTATKTLEAAQACYEVHKVLSYPRTDSSYLPSDMEPMVVPLVQRVQALGGDYKDLADMVLAQEDVPTSRLINDAKVTDHHALAPTDSALDLSPLSDTEKKIFDLVARRFLASLLPPQLLEKTRVVTRIDTSSDPERFKTTGTRVVDEGWKVALPDVKAKDEQAPDNDDSRVAAVAPDEQVKVDKVARTSHKTKPPLHFTEATLLQAMSTAGKLLDDESLAEAMKDSGLGTPATRASILERLVRIGYIERSGRKILSTDKGRTLILALGDSALTSPSMTGSWEKELRDLERAKPADVDAMSTMFLEKSREFAQDITAWFNGKSPEDLRKLRRKLYACPVPGCTGGIVETPKAWACDSWKSKEDPGCGFVFWKTQSGKKTTPAQLKKYVESVQKGEVKVMKPGEKIVLGSCPICQSDVTERAKAWVCTSWKSKEEPGCGYVIWKTSSGAEVSEEEAKQMLARGESNATVRVVLGPCPRCGQDVLERSKGWGCSSWKGPKQKGCGYAIWKSKNDGSEVTKEEALELLAKGETNATQREVLGPCPKCKGEIVDKGKSWGCTSYKGPKQKGCQTTIWKNSNGKDLTKEDALEALAALKSS